MIELVDVDSIKPSTYNPRSADEARLDILEKSLKKLGFILPLYVDADGEIISGHQRHLIATRLGVERVPVYRTKAMSLSDRKALNIVFNRGTNDMDIVDTPQSLTEALGIVQVDDIAEQIPDKRINSPEFYRCMDTTQVPVEQLTAANTGRWNDYATNIAGTLLSRGIEMPVVATPDNVLTNGIGRLAYWARRKRQTVPVVHISHQEAALSSAVLNLLSMDFDIHNRYENELRYNSFRRARRVRDGLGRGFVFAVNGAKPAREFDIADPADKKRWVAEHGVSIVDFGAGHLTETNLLQEQGIAVAAFEPYHTVKGQIDKQRSLEIVTNFLMDVQSGRRYSSIFISSVLNSVPFVQDRQKIVQICAALCHPSTRVYACASSQTQVGWENINGAKWKNSTGGKAITFKLEYEDGISIGDIQVAPKVQKFHTQKEFYELFKTAFRRVSVSEQSNNVQAICEGPIVDRQKLREAIEFEFNLPYPDGSTMGLADMALECFGARLGVKI